METVRDNYTRYPRVILWLMRGGMVTIGGDTPDAEPAFAVQVDSFYLSKLPVTNLQYEAFDPAFERHACSPGDDDPAAGVEYMQARDYCAWYARVSRKGMRLPTEIEWEYACRGGTTSRCFFDEGQADSFVWHAGNSGEIIPPVRQVRPNPVGLLAMLGGVWEWTGSLHRPYPAKPGDGRNDPNTAGPRVLRGGSWRTPLERIGSGVRRACDPATRVGDVGFRVARSLVGDG